MLQNKLLFNSSSVSLEIIGLPDYSNNENKDQISIISQWRLMIIDKPLIEGNVDHLISIMEAFYSYSNFLINNEVASYESKLIDIKFENFITHNVLLKSSKPEVKPLKIKIGNSVLTDIINCFDQLTTSSKVRKILSSPIRKNISKKGFLNLIKKDKVTNIFLPPIISLSTLLLFSTALIFYYHSQDKKENKVLINSSKLVDSVKYRNALV